MSSIAICMADGCEEIEALTVVDVLRRAGIKIDMLSISDSLNVKGSHGIEFKADYLMTERNSLDYDGIVLPGGMPGTTNLEANTLVQNALKKQFNEGKLVAAICAAPSILGKNGIANGKKVTSYPGFEDAFPRSTYVTDSVVTDGNVITSRGMGTAIDFALAIIEYLISSDAAEDMAKNIMYR